jgi:hypothetical protein
MGYLDGPSGEKSSGRLIKVASFLVAVGLAIAGILQSGAADVATVALFLGVALGAEVAQKVTGK